MYKKTIGKNRETKKQGYKNYDDIDDINYDDDAISENGDIDEVDDIDELDF